MYTGNRTEIDIKPDEGWVLYRIIYNGEDEKEINPNGMIYKTPILSENAVIYVYFSEAEKNPETIKIYSNPEIITHGEDIYYFGKIYASFVPDEFGILLSEDAEVTEDDEKITAKFSPDKNTGSFGFQLKNKTKDESLVVYLRPYAVYNGVMNLGETVKIDWDSVKGILDEKTVNGFLENNGLNYSGIMDFVLDE